MSEDISEREIKALISLLDDTDEEVLKHVHEKLMSYGEPIRKYLEDQYLAEPDPDMQLRINDMIEHIHTVTLRELLLQWAQSGAQDLFEGAYLAAKFKYPDLNKEALNIQLEKIRLDCWLELNFQYSPIDKIRVLNHIFFDVVQFSGNIENYHAPDNSYINRVLELRQGNPISLAIIYSIICQRLNIPVFGVNLPQHFVLAYKDDLFIDQSALTWNRYMDQHVAGDVLFYINPFNKGAIFSRANLDQFLKQINIPPSDMYYLPCSNVDIVLRIFRNLIHAYTKLNDEIKVEKLNDLVLLLQPFSEML